MFLLSRLAISLVHCGRQDGLPELFPVRFLSCGRWHSSLASRACQCATRSGATSRCCGLSQWWRFENVFGGLRLRRHGKTACQWCTCTPGMGGWTTCRGGESHQGHGHKQLITFAAAWATRCLRCYGLRAPGLIPDRAVVNERGILSSYA